MPRSGLDEAEGVPTERICSLVLALHKWQHEWAQGVKAVCPVDVTHEGDDWISCRCVETSLRDFTAADATTNDLKHTRGILN